MADWTDSQRNAVFNTDLSLVVSAGAGSGKTRVLVGRYVHLIESGMAELDQIVAITFTDKAATEMKARVWAEMAARERAARDDVAAARRWRELSRRLSSQARISTIDSFCARLVRENPLDAGVDPQFAVVDPADASSLLRQACLGCLDDMVGAGDDLIAGMVSEHGVKAVLEALELAYQNIRTTGRTARYYVQLTAEMAVQECATDGEAAPVDEVARHVRAAEAVARACEELDARYRRLKGNGTTMDFTDIELAARDLLRSGPAGARVRAGIKFVMVDEYQDTNELQHEIVQLLAGDPPENRVFLVGDVKQSIYGFRGAQVDVFRGAMEIARIDCDRWCMETLDKNFRSVRPLVALANAVFGPALGDELWTSDAEAARQVHPGAVHHAELHVITHGMGETPAVSKAEAELVARRIARMVEGGEQLISTGADATGEVGVRAPRYRDMAILLRKSTNIKLFETELRAAGVPYYVVAGKGFHDQPEIVTLLAMMRTVCDNRDDLSLAAVLRHPVFGLSDASLLRLVRAGGDLCSGFIGANIADLSAMGDAAHEPGADEAEKLEWARRCIGNLRAMSGRLGPAQMLRVILDTTGFEAYVAADGDGRQAVGNIEKLLKMADERGRAGLTTLEFVSGLERAGAESVREPEAPMAAEGADVVTLMTVHKSKGLEFPIVFVPQLCRGTTSATRGSVVLVSDRLGIAVKPSSDESIDSTRYGAAVKADIGRAEKEESMRTLYVAATRASDYLVLTSNLQLPKAAVGDTSLDKAKEWLVPFAGALSPCMVDQPASDTPLPEGSRVAVAVIGQNEDASVLVTITPLAAAGGGERGVAPSATPQPLRPSQLSAEPPMLVRPVTPAAAVKAASVSALMCLDRCRRWYVYEYGLGLGRIGQTTRPEALRGPTTWLNASQRGQVVHAVCRQVVTGGQAATALRRELDSFGVTGSARAEVEARLSPMISRFLKSPEACLGGVWEQPFLLDLRGTVVSGIMDLVIAGAGGDVTIVDLKTNTIEEREVEAAAKDYMVQMRAYALAAHRGLGAGSVTTVLNFLHPDKRVTMQFGHEEFAVAEEHLVSLARQAAACDLDSARPVRSHHCDICYYSQLCLGEGAADDRDALWDDIPDADSLDELDGAFSR